MINMIQSEYLRRHGFFNDTVTDGEGNPVPWMSLPAIDLLKDRVPQGIFVFEYGCGYGTLWWSTRARKVVSVEHDAKWLCTITPQLPSNAHIIHKELEYGGEYAKTILSMKGVHMDIVVIDGRDRQNCTKYVLDVVDENTVIVFDNADIPEYAEAIAMIKAAGYKDLPLRGPVHINIYGEDTTTIFYKQKNCLKL